MRRYGWKPDRMTVRHPILALPPEGMTFPDVFSLRPGMPEVYDQGQTMSCTGNGVAAVLQFDRKAQGKEDWTPSRKFPYYNGRKREETEWQDQGAMICDVVDSLSDAGYCRETTCPFEEMDTAPSDAAYAEGLQNLIPARAKLVQNAAAFKHALMAQCPIIMGMLVYSGFESPQVAKSAILDLPTGHEQFMGGHCVDIVGWRTVNGILYWETRNSWGKSFGDDGYFWATAQYFLRPDFSSDFTVIPKA